jgi:hypothetical protein
MVNKIKWGGHALCKFLDALKATAFPTYFAVMLAIQTI